MICLGGKKWHVGCFACSVCNKVFVLKFFNTLMCRYCSFFQFQNNSAADAGQHQPAGKGWASVLQGVIWKGILANIHNPPPRPSPQTNQPAKQYPNRQRTSYGGASRPVPSCLDNRHDPVDYIIIFINIVTIIIFSDLPQQRVWSKRLRIRCWSGHSGWHWILNEVIIV